MLYTCSFFSFLQSHYLLFFIKYYLVTIQASFSLSDTSVNHDEFINNTIKGYTWEVEWGWLVKAIEKSLKSLKIRGWCLKSPKNWWGYWYMAPNVFFWSIAIQDPLLITKKKTLRSWATYADSAITYVEWVDQNN